MSDEKNKILMLEGTNVGKKPRKRGDVVNIPGDAPMSDANYVVAIGKAKWTDGKEKLSDFEKDVKLGDDKKPTAPAAPAPSK